jgi:hypothetical protein
VVTPRLAVIVVAIAACTVDRASDKLKCSLPADCTGGRTCVDGYCVVGGAKLDAPTNMACDDAAKTCTITGTGGANVTCPAGYTCTVECTATSGCNNIDCTGAKACTIHCDAVNGCHDISCGATPCTID